MTPQEPLRRPALLLAVFAWALAAQGAIAAAPAPSPDDYPDFPAAIRRAEPVTDIRQAAVYTVNELIDSEYGLAAARKAGSDVAIRGWFKWNAAPDWSRLATLGARLEIVIDGRTAKTVDLPDLDRKNDAKAPEYNRTIEVAIPPGRHRIGLRNTGGDWAYVESYSFTGRLEDWR